MINQFSGLVCDYPCCDLDGTPWPGCNHQEMTTDPVEISVIQGIANTILMAGLPSTFVRAGDRIETSWGCERNKRKTSRQAIVTSVTVGLYRDRQSMWYRPAYQYCAREGNCLHYMHLTHIRREDGTEWRMPQGGSWSPFYFRLEWVSPLHGGIQRGDVTL